ncbi:MmgE/PrpD family protein [Pseudoroseomonas cervicalis]|uniref:MmgE/PrpD family protein n=1 Tax=Teichococcus cervicalis TaxID=204525 RepID=UPI002786A0CA|nr:MmgE/PrpD family protein [Pseudoroseomonas cervicalis]MDQ1079443.1 2-methylcitrate dehydratase PrpD [Pseudoroseomonas cervicalis]
MRLAPLPVLAAHAAAWRDAPWPEGLERHARRALLDWFAATLPGTRQAPATLLAPALAAERGQGAALCYVDGQRGAPRHAALLNGVASHTVEFDDIHRDSGLHPGSPTVAAALALAQAHGAGMDALLRAMVAGYEVGGRVALAVQPSHYRMWHTTATIGTLAAAAAGAVLLGCNAARTGHAIALAATMTGGLQQAFRGSGMSKPMHAGRAAEAGLLAAQAAAAGVTGAPDVLEGPAGLAAATSESTGRWELALDGLGTRPIIAAMTFKNHGCCGHIFPALDGLLALRARHPFRPEEVARLHVAGYRATAEMCDRPQAEDAQQARFSLQYCAAALLHHGAVRLDAFAPARLRDPVLRAFMSKVSVSLAPELAEAYPRRRAARLRLELQDGTVLTHEQPTRKGDPEDPLTDAELDAKFDELAGPVLGAAGAAALRALIRSGTALPGALAPG